MPTSAKKSNRKSSTSDPVLPVSTPAPGPVTDKTWFKVSRDTLAQFYDCSAFHRKRMLWDPQAFVIEGEQLERKIIEASVQERSLQTFVRNPRAPMTYIVAGAPDDEKAKYFAAYLADVHRQRLGINADVHWERVFNGYDNQLVRRDTTPSMIVLSNLSTKSNYLKYDKAKDVCERFGSVPKIIVVAGEDPISFAATRLHVPCHGIAYFPNAKLLKTVQEVI